MQENSSEENIYKTRTKGRKRCERIEKSESEESNDKNNNSIEKENFPEKESNKSKKNYENNKNNIKSPKNEKQLELQKKLKFIFNEVREKGKYEYNKQDIPENLKYHSDESDSSDVSGTKKSIISRKVIKTNNNEKENQKINTHKKQITEINSERTSGKIKKPQKLKDVSSNNSGKKSNNNKSKKNKETTNFDIDEKLKKINEEDDYDKLDFVKNEKRNKNILNNNSGKKNIIKKK